MTVQWGRMQATLLQGGLAELKYAGQAVGQITWLWYTQMPPPTGF